MSFNEEEVNQIIYFRDELTAILNNDADELIKNHGYEPEDGEDTGAYYFADQIITGCLDPMSGFALDKKFDCEVFDDNTSYMVFHRTVDYNVDYNVDYIVGSNGDAYLRYYNGEQKIDRIYGHYEKSPLHEMAGNIANTEFTENDYVMDDDEMYDRQIKELGCDNFKDYLTENVADFDAPVVSFEKFVNYLSENSFNAENATYMILKEEEYNVCDVDGINFKKEDFIKDIEAHVEAIKNISYDSDFEDARSIFGVDEEYLTTVDFDDLDDEFEAAFNPEVEVKVKNKVSPKP